MTFDPPITTNDVKAVGDLTGADLSLFIATAQIIIDENLDGKGLTDARLRLIAVYLAAHFAFLKEGQVKSEKIGAASTTFNVESGQAFASTIQGQQAMALDTTGTLARLNESAKGNIKPSAVRIDIC